jgi:acyl carrier protein
MDKIIAILSQIRPEFDFLESTDFFEEGILDSFDLITLVSELDQAFGISIDGMDILPTNFCNINAIAALLKRNGVAP